jgi:DNA invertase Pin-like site-specific DNA recombinase
MGEPAGVWFRVSSGGQDEENQVPDVMKWVDSHGYDVREQHQYVLHGKSASKGEQQKALDEMLADMRSGAIKVLVVWRDDRIERRGMFHMTDLIRQVTEAGGRIEFVTQPHLNDLSTMAGRISLTVMSEMAREESATKSDRVRLAHSRIRGNAAVMGRAPFGYEIPQIFARVIAGDSLDTVCRWLEAEGVAPVGIKGKKTTGWWPRALGKIVHNRTYAGHQVDAQGRTIHQCEPLVDAATFARAGKTLANREKRGPLNPEGGALFAGNLFCPRCGGSMYRIRPSHKRKDGTTTTIDYYRCYGRRGAQGKGCGAPLLRTTTVEYMVGQRIARMTRHILREVIVPGNDHSAEIEEVKFAIKQLGTEDLPDEEYDARLAALRAERDRLAALPATEDEVTYEDTGESYAERWARLSPQERRTWLKSAGIRFWACKPGVEINYGPGVEEAPLAEDQGVLVWWTSIALIAGAAS